MRSFVFLLSGLLAGLVAVTGAMTAPQASDFGVKLTTLSLIVAVVGGLGSVSGAFLAGILLGIVDRFSSAYIGQFYTTVILPVVRRPDDRAAALRTAREVDMTADRRTCLDDPIDRPRRVASGEPALGRAQCSAYLPILDRGRSSSRSSRSATRTRGR